MNESCDTVDRKSVVEKELIDDLKHFWKNRKNTDRKQKVDTEGTSKTSF